MPTIEIQRDKQKTEVQKRRTIQWILAPIVIIVIGLGWKYPWMGYMVPLVMMMGIVGSLFDGRFVCGHFCPRGGFFDRMVSRISPKKPIPIFLRNITFRWILFSLMMGFMVFRIAQNPGDPNHWGLVFWMICVVTTAIGLIMAFLIHPRSWCSICPMGTMQNAIGGGKNQLHIEGESCRSCHLCEKACPMNLPIVKYKDDKIINERDCLHCSECVAVCPKSILHWD